MQGPADVDIQRGPDRGGGLVHRSERDPDAKRRRHCPARHLANVLPLEQDAVLMSWDSAILHAQAHEPSILVSRPLSLERVASDEQVVPFHEPCAVHLERRLMPVEILPGQQVALLEAKGVPRAESDRPDPEVLAGFQDRLPDSQALRREWQELESRLARVACPRGEEGDPSTGNGGPPSTRHGGVLGLCAPPPLDFRWNRPRRGPPGRRRHEVEDRARKRLHAREVHGREPLKEVRRPRSLQREAEKLEGAIGETHALLDVTFQPRHDGRAWPGVAHEKESVRREARDDHVIDDRAVVPQQMRVPRATRRPSNFIRTERIEERMRREALDEDLSHVTHVEEADRLAHGQVLLDDARVEERHLPTAELDEPSAGGPMPIIQRRARRHRKGNARPNESLPPGKAYPDRPRCPRPPWVFSASSATSSAPCSSPSGSSAWSFPSPSTSHRRRARTG